MSPYDTAVQVVADQAHLLHPQHHPSDHLDPQIWVAGEGALITNSAGQTFLDGLSGMWNVHVGHGRRELVEAAAGQLSRLAFASSYIGDTSLPAIALAERLSTLLYPTINAFFFTSGGAEASDSAFKTARFFWKTQGRPEKIKIISRTLSYHGSTMAASSASGVPAFWEVFEPRVPGFLHIESPYPYRFAGGGDGVTPGIAAANLLEEAILREGPETVAAFIAEPIQGGGGGVIVPPADYFPRIRAICDQYDVLLISDDVITGFGRTGRWFGLEHWGVEPDIVQFAKGITSGYVPLGGIGVSDRIKAAIDAAPAGRRWMHGFTYSAHPVCCAVALANLQIIEGEDLVERAAQHGAHLLGRLKALEQLEHVGEVRGLGLLAGVEIVADRETKARFPAEAGVGKRLRAELTRRGLYTRVLGEVICLAPPLITSVAQLDRIADILHESIPAALAR
ncbi:MAG: aspartate aminotransferase family protein [Chloroflexales bacterium]|nr:aspartate aminotransferase family protein [Chloroflexales bacterium]